MGGVGTTLGNGYEIQGQNYVAKLQGRVLWVWSRCRNFMLGISCFRWIIFDMLNLPNGKQGRLTFRRSVIVSREDKFFNFWYCEPSVMLIASARSQSARGASLTISHSLLVTRVCPAYLVKEGCFFQLTHLSKLITSLFCCHVLHSLRQQGPPTLLLHYKHRAY